MAIASERATDTLTGAEAAVEMLKAHGVEILFGLCGDTSLPFYDALARLPHGMRHILARDERSAAYMADGYARVSGKVGVCEGPSGGGVTYILPGLAEANESSVPLLCINSDISVSARGRYTLTELDQGALMRPVTKWNMVVNRAEDVPLAFRAAFKQITTGRPGAAHIALPFDVQNGTVKRAEIWGEPSFGRYPAERLAPDAACIERASHLLQDAARPVFICGGGVMMSEAEPELLELAERLSAPVATTISGKGSISEDHPLAVGVVGSNGGTPETRAIVDQADLIMFIGCRAGSVTTERRRHPAPGQSKIIHLDVDPAVPGVNYPADAALIGDAKLGLRMLNQALANTKRPLDATQIEAAKEQKFAKFQALAESADRPIKPERVVAELGRVLDPDAIVVVDAGTPCPYFSAYYQVHGTGRRVFSNRAHGALGYSMAAAMGAHFARPRSEMRLGDGRRQLRFYLRRARNRGALSFADYFYRDRKRELRLDQSRTEIGLRAALLCRGFRGHRSRRGCRCFRRQELEDHRTQRSRQSVKRSARRGGTDPGRYRLPAAARSKSTGVGMDCVKERQ